MSDQAGWEDDETHGDSDDEGATSVFGLTSLLKSIGSEATRAARRCLPPAAELLLFPLPQAADKKWSTESELIDLLPTPRLLQPSPRGQRMSAPSPRCASSPSATVAGHRSAVPPRDPHDTTFNCKQHAEKASMPTLPPPREPMPALAPAPFAVSIPAGRRQPQPQLPPRSPRFTATHLAYSHPGGSKPLDAKNQDTWFVLTVDDYNAVFGVLDGHGADNGTLVAQVAAEAIKAHMAEHFGQLRTEPEAVFTAAFEKAHEAARQAVLHTDDCLQLVGGVPVDEWEDEAGQKRQEAADGGTTATVIALLDGATLVCAQVGDSSALLGGTGAARPSVGGAGGGGGAPPVVYEMLVEEHSATNAPEYQRILRSGSRGEMVQFVYETPGLLEEGTAPRVWRAAPPGHPLPYVVDPTAIATAAEHGTAPKNCRGELPAILMTPQVDPTRPQMEPQSLAVTRAIGDFYMHTFGVTCVPEVRVIDLAAKMVELERALPRASPRAADTEIAIILASDGIWDLWETEDVFRMIGSAPAQAATFFEASVERGSELFGSSADNMTGITVYLKKARATASEPAAPTVAAAVASAAAPSASRYGTHVGRSQPLLARPDVLLPMSAPPRAPVRPAPAAPPAAKPMVTQEAREDFWYDGDVGC